MKSSMGLTLCCLLSLVLCTASLDLSEIEVYPENGGISGVFMAMLKNKAYSFNASTATEVCRSLSARIATKAEVEMAHRDGLETCRFGWVEENIVVVPRINQHEKCGKNKVGVVSWFTSTSRLFEVFCFNLTGQSEVATTTTSATTNPVDRGPQDNTTFPRPIQSTASNKHFLSPSSSVPSTSSGFSTSVAYTSFPSTVSSMATRSPPSLSPSTAHYPISTSSSSSTAPYSSTTLFTHLLTYSSSLNSSSNQTGPPALDISTASFGEVPTACVVIAVMLILMAAAGAVWYFKIKRSHRLPPWVRIRHKDMVETEMWKQTEQKQTGKNKETRSSSEDIPLQLEDTDSA